MSDASEVKRYCTDYLGIEPQMSGLRINHLDTLGKLLQNIDKTDNEILRSPIGLLVCDQQTVARRGFTG